MQDSLRGKEQEYLSFEINTCPISPEPFSDRMDILKNRLVLPLVVGLSLWGQARAAIVISQSGNIGTVSITEPITLNRLPRAFVEVPNQLNLVLKGSLTGSLEMADTPGNMATFDQLGTITVDSSTFNLTSTIISDHLFGLLDVALSLEAGPNLLSPRAVFTSESVVINPHTSTFTIPANFDPAAFQVFTGDAYLVNSTGNWRPLTADAPVGAAPIPESSSLLLLLAAAAPFLRRKSK